MLKRDGAERRKAGARIYRERKSKACGQPTAAPLPSDGQGVGYKLLIARQLQRQALFPVESLTKDLWA